MARIVKADEYAARRKDILDAAMRLVYSKGYGLMTIQDILDELKISKGAFYHYFDSKGAVLEALVERIVVDEVLPLLLSKVDDPSLSALEKMHAYFDLSARWKTANKDFVLELLRVWQTDENAIVRQKMVDMSLRTITPMLTQIIRQGVREGVFNTPYPDQASHVTYFILMGLSDKIVELMLSGGAGRSEEQIESSVTGYIDALADAMERVLGAPKGSLHLIDPEVLKVWFVSSEEPVPL